MRRNGLESPLDPHQIASWFAYAYLLGSYYALYTPLHLDAVGIALTSVYSALALLIAVVTYRCTKIDPSDPGVLAKRAGTNALPASAAAAGSGQNFCYFCEAHVNARSKHCRRCNKCVDVFDHHCPWLNTCIGATNYRLFLLLLCAVFMLNIVQLGSTVQAGLAQRSDAGRRRLDSTLGGLGIVGYLVLLSAAGLATFISLMLVAQLLFFHFGLIYRGVTTYEFIVAQRRKQKARDAELQRGDTGGRCVAELQKNAPCLAICELCCDPSLTQPPTPRGDASSRRPGSASRKTPFGITLAPARARTTATKIEVSAADNGSAPAGSACDVPATPSDGGAAQSAPDERKPSRGSPPQGGGGVLGSSSSRSAVVVHTTLPPISAVPAASSVPLEPSAAT